MPNTHPKSPPKSPPANGRNSTTSFGPSFPSAPAAAAEKCTRSAPTPSTTAPSAKALKASPTMSPSALASQSPRPSLRHCLRHPPQLAPLRRTLCRNHGRRRLQSFFSRRLPQHARIFVRRSPHQFSLRHHGHRQPQSAQRQCRQSLLGGRRPSPAAARQGDHRSRDERRRNPPQTLRRSPRRRTNCLSAKGNRRRLYSPPVHNAITAADREGLKNHLLSAARRRSIRRASGAGRRLVLPMSNCSARTPNPTAISPTSPATFPTRKTPPSSTSSSIAPNKPAPI